MIRTQIQLTDEQARRVRAMARREGVSMALLVASDTFHERASAA